MPFHLAGSRGGIQPAASNDLNPKNSWLFGFLHRLLAGELSLDDVYDILREHAELVYLTCVINNSCNLSCKHCYLKVKELYGKPLLPDEWDKVFHSATTVFSPRMISLVGKEVFLGPSGVNVFKRLTEYRDRVSYPLRVGAITNGTLIGPYLSEIFYSRPDYFDISLEGIGQVNDFIRGEGSYDSAISNIALCAKEFDNRFFITSTLQRSNVERLPETILILNWEYGVQNFALGFYNPMPYTPKELVLDRADLENLFFQIIPTCGEMDLKGSVKLLFDVDTTNIDYMSALLEMGIIDFAKLRLDGDNDFYTEYEYPNGMIVSIKIMPFPNGFWRSVRITAEGLYIASEDTTDTRNYFKNAIGNVKDHNFDLRKLFERSLEKHSRFYQILEDYYFNKLPLLIERNLVEV